MSWIDNQDVATMDVPTTKTVIDMIADLCIELSEDGFELSNDIQNLVYADDKNGEMKARFQLKLIGNTIDSLAAAADTLSFLGY